MVLAEEENTTQTNSKKRRARRKKLKLAVAATNAFFTSYFNILEGSCDNPIVYNSNGHKELSTVQVLSKHSDSIDPDSFKNCDQVQVANADNQLSNRNTGELNNMSSRETDKSRDEVKAAREAKKLAKQKAKTKGDMLITEKVDLVPKKSDKGTKEPKSNAEGSTKAQVPIRCVDEVDRAITKRDPVKTIKPDEKALIFAESRDKKTLKQDKTKSELEDLKSETTQRDSTSTKHDIKIEAEKTKPKPDAKKASEKPEAIKASEAKKASKKPEAMKASEAVEGNPEMTLKDVVETLKDIKKVAIEVQDLTAKVSAISFEAKDLEAGKSKSELKAERRAKQEAQRAAKQAALEQKVQVQIKAKPAVVEEIKTKDAAKEKSPKPKTDKTKVKSGSAGRVNWFQHLHTELDKDALNKIPINSNLHPAIIKLGVRLATRVVSGSNARCVALLDALKKMVKDYTLPAKTEFARGLESYLTTSLEFLWSMRRPSASQSNAIKYFRHQLQQLPNNVDEFDAKKKLQEEIDKYIEDQIDKAGEAISETVRHKISTGDNILTYGCSSLIERILREAWEAKVEFRTIIVGNKVHNGAREMMRRLTVAGLHCTYADITAISYVMKSINKVILGASSLLVNGSVLGAVGTAQVALAAKECNVPVLVACETHKFSEKVQTDAFVYNELGNPDELINQYDNSPLKDWRNNPNLTLLNVTYDVTPPSLVTAVVTEKAILPCTSAPVVLRTKLSEYGM